MILFVTALKAEADPIIRHCKLTRRADSRLFSVYANPTQALVISGPGKTAAAAATAWLYQLLHEPEQAVWINIGIAGHASFPLESLMLAHKIIDAASDECWYPPQAAKHTLLTCDLITVDKPETAYALNGCAYDMEAAGFYRIASRCSSAELVQSCKIVSDNPQFPVSQIDRSRVGNLIASKLDSILLLAGNLERLAAPLRPAVEVKQQLETFKTHWHFTVSQVLLLERLLLRWQVLIPAQPCAPELFIQCKNSAQVLETLRLKTGQAAMEMRLHG